METINQEDIQRLAKMINHSKMIVFYGGAGTSTESGIPDYRSRYGIWTKMEEKNQSPVEMASAKRLNADPEEFFRFEEDRDYRVIKPHQGHYILSAMEKSGKDIRVITQNVDGLHQEAGHRFVLELHGTNRTWHCMTCGRVYKRSEVEIDQHRVPRCYVDQGVVRPDVLFFGENADSRVVEKSKETLAKCDLIIIAGTSLTTGLAKRLVRKPFDNKSVVIINQEPLDVSPLSVDLFIQAPVGKVLAQAKPYLTDKT